MKKLFIITILLSTLVGCSSGNSDWIPLGKKNDGTYYYGELKTLDKDKRTGWIKYEYKEPVIIGKKTYDTGLYHEQVNCSTRKIRSIERVWRSSKHQDIIRTTTPEPWETVIPDSVGNSIFEWICRH